MIKTILIFSLISFVSFFQTTYCGKNETPKNQNTSNKIENKHNLADSKSKENLGTKKDSATAKAEKFLKISELNKEKPNEGIFETKGFVVKITNCKACPPDSICKPCMAENLLVSEENKTLDKYDLTERELIIFTKETEKFTKGREYKFNIKITDKKSTSAELNDIELISFED